MILEVLPSADVEGLTPAEFDELDGVIRDGMQTFVKVGLALIKVRDLGLAELRRRGYRTFEAYLDTRCGFSRQEGYRLMWAAEAITSLPENVTTAGQINQAQAETLHILPEPLRIEVAKQVDFSQTSVRELRRIVKDAKATLDAKVEEAKANRPPAVLPVVTPLPEHVSIRQADATALPIFSDSIDLIVTSPPYGLDKDYGTPDDPRTWAEEMFRWVMEMWRVAKPGGRLALNVPLDTAKDGERPTYSIAVTAAQAAGWRYRSTIVWNEGNVTHSVGRGSVDSPACPYVMAPVEMVALFSKGDWKRDGQGIDLTHTEWLEWTNGVWTFGGESRPWEGHPAPFPEELPRRLIKLLSFVGDTVLDPFCGSGTAAVVAQRLGRKFYGFDISPDYVASAQRRVAKAVNEG